MSVENQITETETQSEPEQITEVSEGDSWSDALEAYEETPADDEDEYVPEESEPKSHLEQGEQPKDELLTAMEMLRVPQKYKGAVKEFLESQLKDKTGKVQEEIENHKKINDYYVNVFKEVLQQPEKLREYALKYGKDLGLEDRIIQAYNDLDSNQRPEPKKEISKADKVTVDAIFDKYWHKMSTSENPAEVRDSLKAVIAESVNLSKSEMTSYVGDLLKQAFNAYHTKMVDPNLKTIRKQEEAARFTSRKNTWNDALSQVQEGVKEFGDFDKYKPQILERLKSHPLTPMLNENPDALIAQGITHKSLIEEAYNLLSRHDHIESAKKKREWKGGLEPNPKHITTTKASVDDWDDIKNEYFKDES